MKYTIFCPVCGSKQIKTVDTRLRESMILKRRRECLKCGARYTTAEITNSDFKNLLEAKKELDGIKSILQVVFEE